MKLVLMRGVSGSGKSTLAREIAQANVDSVIYSTDDFFMVDGEHVFDPKRLGEYHRKNVEKVKTAMNNKTTCIIVDNTNTQAWEMKPYVELAVHYGYEVEIVSPKPVGLDELMIRQAQRQDQNKSLSIEIVKRMLDRFENNVTVQDILASKRPF